MLSDLLRSILRDADDHSWAGLAAQDRLALGFDEPDPAWICDLQQWFVGSD